ncbi:MAG TPA: succinylglutamate desuccinylase/aspartoacylase family protein, partial [Salinimicrobium sp.]|nr:succinylglutamate desuccinylase/aspartoacylase family protein [Salinimicrobium sp.]
MAKMDNISRIIGKYGGKEDGPLLLVTAGVHGNEPSGVLALQKIFKELEQSKMAIKGTFLGLFGNKKALQQGKRYIDEDLNRTWTKENLKKDNPDSHEQQEMKEIVELLENYSEKQFPERFFMDCHTTSSDSLPYISVQEVGKNDAFAHKFPLHIVRGFSDIVNGSIDKYFSQQGFTGFTFEGGQHTAETTQANQEAMIWLALKEVNGADLNLLPRFPDCIERLEGGQTTFEIIYRHGLEDNDEFRMEPGFKNFQKIKKDELLAIQNGKEIRSEWDATIFMPLYQSQGNDGFFIIKEV